MARSTPASRLPLIALFALLASIPARSARASDAALAEALFQEGKRLMAEKRYAEACPKLEESQRADPGGGTLLAIAACHEEEGKLAAAWAEYGAAAAVARRDGRKDRLQIAERRAAAIEPRLGRLSVHVADEAARVTITRDDVEVPTAAWGTPIPVDPGEHVVRASAPGRSPWTMKLSVGEGELRTLTVPPLAALPAPAGASSPRVGGDAHPDEPRAEDGATRRTVGYVLAGVGAIGAGVGAYFGVNALDAAGVVRDRCPVTPCSDEGAVALNDRAKTWADVATVAIPAGIAVAALGVVLLWTAPSGERASAARLTPGVARHGASLSLEGRF